MALRNDKERMDFVKDPQNWELVGELYGLVRLFELNYKGTTWYSIRLRQVHDIYDFEHKMFKKVQWSDMAFYEVDHSERGLLPTSPTSIIKIIKSIDKKEKETS